MIMVMNGCELHLFRQCSHTVSTKKSRCKYPVFAGRTLHYTVKEAVINESAPHKIHFLLCQVIQLDTKINDNRN